MSDEKNPYGKLPYKLIHTGSKKVCAEFHTAGAAHACRRGLEVDPDRRVQTWFHFEDANGERITLHDLTHAPGHAYALLEQAEKVAP